MTTNPQEAADEITETVNEAVRDMAKAGSTGIDSALVQRSASATQRHRRNVESLAEGEVFLVDKSALARTRVERVVEI